MIENRTVSIILPAFNAEKTISRSVESVLNQTYIDWELIVVDDASTDNTLSMLDKYTASNRIKLIRQNRNQGVAHSRNVGLKQSTGQFIAFIDADDEWLPIKLERQIFYLLNGSNIVYSNYYLHKDSHLKEIAVLRKIYSRSFFLGNPIPNLTGIYNRDIGITYQKNVKHEDYVMWFDLVSKNGEATGILEPLANYYSIKGSISSNKYKSALWHWNILRNEFNLSKIKSLLYFSCYIYKSIIKHYI